MDSKKLVFIAIVVLAAFITQSCGEPSATKEQTKADVTVRVARASMEKQPENFRFSGKLEAENHSNLSTRIMGQIAKIHVAPGQKVKKGQLLVQIHNQDILAKKAQVKANVVEAEAAFASAEKDLKRYQSLMEQKSASQKEMDDITTGYNMAKARLDAAKQMGAEVDEMLRYVNIKAPYNGVITRKYVNEGDLASPGMPLLAMEQAKEFKVLARIPETEIGSIKKGDSVKVKISALNNVLIDGVVTEVNPSAIYTGSQFEAKILLKASPEHKERLFSGMYATVLLEKGSKPGIRIPEHVLIHRGQLTGIYTISQSGTAMLRWIRTGKSSNGQIEVLSGLKDGEQYVISYDGKIWDGANVNIQ